MHLKLYEVSAVGWLDHMHCIRFSLNCRDHDGRITGATSIISYVEIDVVV